MSLNAERIPVGILGATGAVGQKFVELLAGHPWFEVAGLAASERSAGRTYREVVDWKADGELPARIGDLVVDELGNDLDCRILFSALPASEARVVERESAEAGYAVISNASAYRMAADVPLVIPEVNADALELVTRQPSFARGGFIVTNPNCSATGLVCTLKPIRDAFGLRHVQVTTLQALSGAGYPGVPSLDATANVIPYISKEEEKLEEEPQKLLDDATFTVSAQCNRVPVVDGHTLCVSVALKQSAAPEDVAAAVAEFRPPFDPTSLPSAPAQFLRIFDDDASPQPRKHVSIGQGMTVSVGRIRSCPVNDVKYVALVHNTVRGAAGGAILNAELLVAKGYVALAVQQAAPLV